MIAGPILFLIVLEHGPIFGAQAAALSLSAILASEAFNFAYAWSCRSLHWLVSLAVGMLAWLVVASGLSMLPASPVYGLGAALLAIVFGQAFLPECKVVAKDVPLTGADLVGRMFAAIVLTLLVTTLSSVVGATWSGCSRFFRCSG